MIGDATGAPLTRSGPRPLPIGFSLLLHGGLLSLVAIGPVSRGGPEPRSLYDQVIKPREHDLVWYSFREKLPDVAPAETQTADQPGAEVKLSTQTIISNPKASERGSQMIWRPAPVLRPQPEIPSPNLLAFRMPLIAPPPPGPPARLFVPPNPKALDAPKPAPAIPEPPKLTAKAQTAPDPRLAADLTAAILNRPRPRSFVPPAPKPENRAAPPGLPQAPEVATSLRSERVPLLAENMAAPLANKPQPRQFIPPAAQGRPSAGPVALPNAPRVAGQPENAGLADRSLALVDGSYAALSNKPRPRQFVPPAARAAGGANGNHPGPVIQEAPGVNFAGMPSANVNVAVVGLNPAARLGAPPEGSRAARFSAGPNANGAAGGAAPPSSSALSVPGLMIRDSGASRPENAAVKDPVLVAQLAPTSKQSLQAAAKSAAQAAGGDPPSNSASQEIHIEPPPDPSFSGRDVYSMAVQMPNITSYSGSWILWFAEHGQDGPRRHDLKPPEPLHKVDPKYYSALIAERMEGKVYVSGVIGTDGHVGQVHVLKGIDPQLDRSAALALLKWRFEPAERNGVPVEVDVVAEIPFVLAPKVPE